MKSMKLICRVCCNENRPYIKPCILDLKDASSFKGIPTLCFPWNKSAKPDWVYYEEEKNGNTKRE